MARNGSLMFGVVFLFVCFLLGINKLESNYQEVRSYMFLLNTVKEDLTEQLLIGIE